MFTGIIEELGIIKSVGNGKIVIGAKKVLEDSKIGDSIAVNGVCLTVTSMKNDEFVADVMNETFSRTSLKELKKGSVVNLERAMSANGRFGGHIVSGHIDGTASISNIEKDNNAIWYTIKADNNILDFIVEKGSVAIDGISLTVAYVDNEVFKVSIIPHTQSETNLHTKDVKSLVNIECDVVGKYIEKFINKKNSAKKESSITEDFLRKHGF